jgi:hypothetical protein
MAWKWTGKAILIVDSRESVGWMAVQEEATNEDMFDALFAISHFGEHKGSVTPHSSI